MAGRHRTRRAAICATAWLALAFPEGALAAAGSSPASLEVQLRPAALPAGEIRHVDVRLRLSPPELSESGALVSLPAVVNNVDTVASGLGTVRAQDARGDLGLALRTEGLDAAMTYHWIPDRPVAGPVTVSYRVPVSNRLAARGAAPPLELRSDAGAFSGAGSTFLLLPRSASSYTISVEWDLSALPSRSAAVSSLGFGNAQLAGQPVSLLERSFFMAGRLGRYRAAAEGQGFFAGWHGNPPFDPVPVMDWAARMHNHLAAFFRAPAGTPYGVFLRHNPVNPGGGVALADSFVATFGPGTDPERLRITLVHEMVHTFAPRLDPAGLETSWFAEGMAVHYQRILPLRTGMIDTGAFLDNLNATAARYYTNALAETPMSQVPARFWEDTRIRTIPYDKGALYFAALDHQIRRASGGGRSLDNLVLALLERQRERGRVGLDDWEELLVDDLGSQAVDDLRAMLAGRSPVPASEAFGPCFRRVERPLRRYELGFDPRVLVEPRRIVRGLLPGSAAEQGGLREGDEIMKPVPQDGIQGDQTALLRLEVRRGEDSFPVVYLPRGETVPAYQWERVGGMKEEQCAI
jgi:predicted metalloprotease with PDZ domain